MIQPVSVLASPVANASTGTNPYLVTYTWPAISQGQCAQVSIQVPGSPAGVVWTVTLNGQQVGTMYGNSLFGPQYIAGGEILSISGYPGTAPTSAIMTGIQGKLGEVLPAPPATAGGSSASMTGLAWTQTASGLTVYPSPSTTGLVIVCSYATVPTVSWGMTAYSVALPVTTIVAGSSFVALGLYYAPFPAGILTSVAKGTGAGPISAIITPTGGSSIIGVWEVDTAYPFEPPTPAAPALVLISSQVLASTTATVTFSSIPGTYNHLVLKAVMRSSVAAETDTWEINLNGDSGSNYNNVVTYGNSSGANSSVGAGGTILYPVQATVPGASATSGQAGALLLEIPSYAATTFFKAVKTTSGYADNVTSEQVNADGTHVWRSTAAVTSLALKLASGSFVAGSSFYLYGLT